MYYLKEQSISPSNAAGRPRAAGYALSACIVGLCLLWAGGCPSKPSPDANETREQRTQHGGQNTEATGEIRDTRHETRDTNRAPSDEPPAVARYGYKIIRTWPHDPHAFTQGLVYEDGFLYEGTGLHGQSMLIKRSLEAIEPIKRERLPRRYFGEGITIFRDRIIQLTWESQTGFVYDKATFRLLREFAYRGEGWGITHNGRQLIMSDGTATLRFLDPNTYAETRRITVRDRGRPVRLLNELEFIPAGVIPSWRGRPALASRGHPGLASSSEDTNTTSELQGQDTLVTEEQGRDALATVDPAPPQDKPGQGLIFANIWSSDSIAIIDPNTGVITAWLDLTNLWPLAQRPSSEHVLNGIAWIPQTNRLLVTGKLWPKLYEIELTEKTP